MPLPSMDQEQARGALDAMRSTIADLVQYLPAELRHEVLARTRSGAQSILNALAINEYHRTWSEATLCLARGFHFTESLKHELKELGEPAHVRAVRDLLEKLGAAEARASTYAKIADAATNYVLTRERDRESTVEAWDELCTTVAAQRLSDLQDKEP